MSQGDKSKYTEKQKRQAEQIEEGYEGRGIPEDVAHRRARARFIKQRRRAGHEYDYDQGRHGWSLYGDAETGMFNG